MSVTEFADRQAVHGRRYFAGPFGTPASRVALAEPMPGRTVEEA
ncbi:hypothetical protein [Streptomyces shenzhenensis]|nr:hypothetical protein [Streptomyces shenzhenensis]